MQDANSLGDQSEQPKIYYGWVMLPLSMLALMATSVGQTYSISAFNKDIAATLLLTETQLAKAYMLGTILGAIPITYFGYLMDRYGLRKTVLVTISLLSVACFSLAMTRNFLMLVVSFCLLRMLGPGTLAMLSGNTMAFWFHKKLGSVEAIRKLSISVAMGGVPFLNYLLLKSFTWQQVQVLWGCGVWFCLFPLFYFFFRNHPEDVGQSLESRKVANPDEPAKLLTGMTFPEAMRTSAFWSLSSGGALFALVMTAIVFNRNSIMEQQGLQEWHSAMMMSVLSATWAITQFLSGNLADRIPAKPLMMLGLLFFGASIFCLSMTNSKTLVITTGCLMGIGQGFYSGASHPLWARHFGRLHLGKITGIWMTMMVAASASGPYFAGVIRDYTGSFRMSLLVFAVLPIPVILQTLLANFKTEPSESLST
ncbi:MAG: MFS transporter [Planctomicrobium sp.]|jgi:MFS transporter, OFA family, oxalate/formate antiporter|nr:MFS transporter [Planctomicrobium sp.]